MTDPRILLWYAATAVLEWEKHVVRPRGGTVPPELIRAAKWAHYWVSKDLGGSPLEAVARMMDGPGMEPLLLNLDATADVCSVSKSTVKRWVSDGRLPAVKAGNRTMVRRVDLEVFTEQLPRSPGSTSSPGPGAEPTEAANG